jgi:hypothetical protein
MSVALIPPNVIKVFKRGPRTKIAKIDEKKQYIQNTEKK